VIVLKIDCRRLFMRQILFVGGIHGVGKTYFCSKISAKNDLPHYSASKLISLQKEIYFSGNKNVEHIEGNQNFLIDALQTRTSNSNIILDGHFCLLNREGIVTEIPDLTFNQIAPKGILVLTNDINIIVNRLNQRDGKEYDLNLLNDFQNKEIEYSQKVAKKLNVPFLLVNSSDENGAVDIRGNHNERLFS
jgi:adenylate kinase